MSPEQAAQVHAAAANGQPFPMPSTVWRPDGDDAGGVYVRSGDVRLHTIQYPDGTWTVDAGRNCS